MVDGFITALVQPDGSVHVLGHSFRRKPADVEDRATSIDDGCPTRTGSVPVIPAGLKHVVERSLVMPEIAVAVFRAILEGCYVVVALRALNEGDAGIGKIAEHTVEKIDLGDEVRIHDRDKIAGGIFERVVEITRLGMDILRSRDVAAAKLVGDCLDLGTVAVVEQPSLVRIVDVYGRQHRPP